MTLKIKKTFYYAIITSIIFLLVYYAYKIIKLRLINLFDDITSAIALNSILALLLILLLVILLKPTKKEKLINHIKERISLLNNTCLFLLGMYILFGFMVGFWFLDMAYPNDLNKYYQLTASPKINNSQISENLRYIENIKCQKSGPTRRSFVNGDTLDCKFNLAYTTDARYHLYSVIGYLFNETTIGGGTMVTNHIYTFPYNFNYSFPLRLNAPVEGYYSLEFEFLFINESYPAEPWFYGEIDKVYIYSPQEYFSKEQQKLAFFFGLISLLIISLPIAFNNVRQIALNK